MSDERFLHFLYRFLFIGISDEKQLMRAWLKSRRDERPQTGANPPVMLQRQEKPRRGDRDLSKLLSNKLDILSPFRGFCFVDVPVLGGSPPSVFFRALGAFLADDNISYFAIRKESSSALMLLEMTLTWRLLERSVLRRISSS